MTVRELIEKLSDTDIIDQNAKVFCAAEDVCAPLKGMRQYNKECDKLTLLILEAFTND